MHIADVIPDDECDGEDGSDEVKIQILFITYFQFSISACNWTQTGGKWKLFCEEKLTHTSCSGSNLDLSGKYVFYVFIEFSSRFHVTT